MIKTFKCKDTEKLFNDLDVKRLRGISRTARIKLELLNAAVSLNSLRVPPGNRLERLKGDIASELITSGVFVSYGRKKVPLK